MLDFEGASTEVLQEDSELATAYTSYSDARRRLSEKFRNRGFWPVNQSTSKGKSYSNKGKHKEGKGKGFSGKGRRSLQQRIMESNCRLCGRQGHWKAECPERFKEKSAAGSTGGAIATVSVLEDPGAALPLEFVNLPEVQETKLDESQPPLGLQFCLFVSNLSYREKIRRRNIRSSFGHGVRNENRMLTTSQDEHVAVRDLRDNFDAKTSESSILQARQPIPIVNCEPILFATYDAYGIVDSGATKTVIGSEYLSDLLNSLKPEVRQAVKRCACRVLFRFGNQGTLESQQALVVPIKSRLLKIAIVPGGTPFLVSNTLLRTLGAIVDTGAQEIFFRELQKSIPLKLNSKGLFMIDLNDLASVPEPGNILNTEKTASTFVQLSSDKEETSASEECMEDSNVEKCERTQEIDQNPVQVNSEPPKSVKGLISLFEQKGDHSSQPSRKAQKSNLQEIPRSIKVASHVPGIASKSLCSSDSCGAKPGGSHELSKDVSLTDGKGTNRVRQDSPREVFSGSVGDRATVGQMVSSHLREEHQSGTCQVSHLLREHDRPSGECPRDAHIRERREQEDQSQVGSKAKRLAKTHGGADRESIRRRLRALTKETSAFEEWEPVNAELRQDLQVMQNRLGHLESALQEVIHHLRVQTGADHWESEK